MTRPIQKRLLIHNVNVFKYVEDGGGWGNNYQGDMFELRNVRVEPTNKVLQGDNGVEIPANILIFVDAFYSTSVDINLKDRISFDGVQHEVVRIDKFYHGSQNTLHHLEVYCV